MNGQPKIISHMKKASNRKERGNTNKKKMKQNVNETKIMLRKKAVFKKAIFSILKEVVRG